MPPGPPARTFLRRRGIPAAYIECHPGERLVHRDGGIGKPGDPASISDRFGKCHSKDNPDILNSVVGIHRKVPDRPDADIILPCRAKEFSMWSKNGIPVSIVPAPEPSRSRERLISVSFVVRWTSLILICCLQKF